MSQEPPKPASINSSSPLSSEQAVRLLSAAIDSCEEAIFITDLRNVITTWNPAAERLFGHSRDEAIGQSASLILPLEPPSPQSHDAEVSEISGGGNEPIETVCQTSDGRQIEVAVSVSPVYAEEGHLVGMSIIARDIASRKQRERSRDEQTKELIRSNVELELFAHAASHDLRAPLRTIRGFLNLLCKTHGDKLDEEALDWIKRSLRSADHLDHMIGSLLEYARVESGVRELVPVDLNEVFDGVVDERSAVIAASGARVERDELPVVRGSAVLLPQVFQNLLANALKYHGKSQPRIQVDAKKLDEGSMWEIRFVDHGMGIDARNHESVFEAFRRFSSDQSRTSAGIGLFICKRVIERHGGRIWIESELGKGTTMHFTLQEA